MADDTHDRAGIARLAAALGNTDDGRALLDTSTDLHKLTALASRLGLQTSPALAVLPGVADVALTVTSAPLRRTLTLAVSIQEATLPALHRTMRIAAGDQHGPQLSGLDAADYLAVPAGAAGQLLTEARHQLTSAGAALYTAAEPLYRRPPPASGPGREPTPAAIDALSDLLAEDARWQAQLDLNDWYVGSVDAALHIDKLTPGQPVDVAGADLPLPASLCELLNDHWRAVYTQTLSDSLDVIDALATPGETAMRSYLDAQEIDRARRSWSLDFPNPPHVSTDPSQAGPGTPERPDEPGHDPGRPPDRERGHDNRGEPGIGGSDQDR